MENHLHMDLQQANKNHRQNLSHTLGELLNLVGEITNTEDDQHHHHQQSHQVLELNETADTTHHATSVPFVLSFKNLSYNVKTQSQILPEFVRHEPKRDNKSQTKVLLDNISGEAREGEIMAVLGASGSGKSTLIDALANRISRGSLKGTITLNDKALDTKVLKVISAYVMQDDLLFPMLTVEETLMFSAEFRLPMNVSKSRKRERVRALIDQLGLQSVAGTVIGDEGRRGVSGGERRRVSIGTDIIHDPILLFLDEPTSGLDSTSAYMVVKVLQRIARSGSVMIMSIHQPSYRILKLLDRLMILSCGQTVFSGTPGSIPRFFAEFGNPMPLNVDKMEFALDYIRDLEAAPGGIQNLVDFNKKWENKRSPETIIDSKNPKRSLKEAISASISKGKLVSGATNVGSSSNLSSSVPKYANPFWKEIIVIADRSITNSRRAPELFGVRFGAVVVTGIILATIFWKLDDSPRGGRERLGFFAFAMSTTFYTCAEAVPFFLLQRYIFVRETAYNAYRRSSFVVSHAMGSIPSLSVLSLAFASITYWSVGLASGGFSFYLAFVFASFWSGHSFVTFLSGIIFNETMAYTVVISILAYYVLLSGFFIARDRIPIYWVWFHYASLVKYPYQGVLMNEFGRGGGGTECFVRGTQVFDDSPLRNVADSLKLKLLESMSEALGMSINGSTCLMTGDDILKRSGVVDLGKWSCLWITVASGFLFRVLFYFALMIGSKNKRS